MVRWDTNNVWDFLAKNLGSGCADHYAQAKVYWSSSDARAGVVARWASSTNHFLGYAYQNWVYLVDVSGGSWVAYDNGTAMPSSGGTIKIVANGTDIRLYWNGSEHAQLTSSNHPSDTYVGCVCKQQGGTSNAAGHDDFEADSV